MPLTVLLLDQGQMVGKDSRSKLPWSLLAYGLLFVKGFGKILSHLCGGKGFRIGHLIQV